MRREAQALCWITIFFSHSMLTEVEPGRDQLILVQTLVQLLEGRWLQCCGLFDGLDRDAEIESGRKC